MRTYGTSLFVIIFLQLFLAGHLQGIVFASGAERDFLFARQAFEDEFYDIAKDRFVSFITNYPSSKDIISAHLYLGRTYFRLNKFERAAYEFEYILGRPDSAAFSDEAVYWLAETYFALEDYRKALELYQRLIDEYPASAYIAYAYYSKGWCYYKIGDKEHAINAFRETAGKFSHNTLNPKAQYMVCDVLFHSGRLLEARKEMDDFITNFPLYSEIGKIYYMRGEIDYKIGDYTAAILDFENALDCAGGADWAKYAECRLAMSFLKKDDALQALAHFDRCGHYTGDASLESAVLFGRARALDALGKIDEALAEYNRIILEYPSSEWQDDARLWKAEALLKLDRLFDAERLYKESINRFKKNGLADEMSYNLGLIYAKKNEYDEAIEIFNSLAVKSADTNLRINALLTLGDIYWRLKKYDDARNAYDVILDKYSDAVHADYAQYKIGEIFYAEDKYDSAVLSFQSLPVNYPGSRLRENAKFQIGMAFFMKGDYAASAKNFTDFIGEFPDSDKMGHALFYLGSSLYNSARYKEALGYFRAVLKRGEDPELVKIAMYEIGWCYYQDGNINEATSEFMRFLKIYPDSELSAQILFWFGERFYNDGNYQKARVYFHKLQTDFPYSKIAADAAYWKASSLYKRGDRRSALRELAAIPEKYPESDLAPKSILKMGELLMEAGDVNGGLRKFEELVYNYPKSAFAKLAHKKAGEALENLRSYGMAAAHYRKALTEEDSDINAEIQYCIAGCLEESGEFKEAVDEYLKVIYLYPSAKFWGIKSEFQCAEIFERNNEIDKAKKIYERLANEPIEEAKYAKERLAWFNQGGN